MDELMKSVVGAVIDSATESTVDAVTNQTETVILETIEDTVATTAVDASAEDLALDSLDLLLDTGAAEGIAALFGAPMFVILGIKFLKAYRKKSKANANN